MQSLQTRSPCSVFQGRCSLKGDGQGVEVFLNTCAALPFSVGVVSGESERRWWWVWSCHDGGNVDVGCFVVLC